MLELIRPTPDALPSYREALERGWSPDTTSDAAIGRELAAIADDPTRFIALMDDLEAKGPPRTQADGTVAPRLPGFRRWLWDGEFAGSFSFRFCPGTEILPDSIPGHIGYAVPEWKRGQGYAKRGLAMLLEEVRSLPLAYVIIATDSQNVMSQGVVTANGGYLVERLAKGCQGGPEELRWRIDLANPRPAAQSGR